MRTRLEWYDAYAEELVSRLHSGLALHAAWTISQVGPYFGAAMVFVALLVLGSAARGSGS